MEILHIYRTDGYSSVPGSHILTPKLDLISNNEESERCSNMSGILQYPGDGETSVWIDRAPSNIELEIVMTLLLSRLPLLHDVALWLLPIAAVQLSHILALHPAGPFNQFPAPSPTPTPSLPSYYYVPLSPPIVALDGRSSPCSRSTLQS